MTRAGLSRFEHYARLPGSVLLESSLKKGDYGRFTVAALRPHLVLEARRETVRLLTARGQEAFEANGLEILEECLREAATESEEGFWGPGAFGYLTYEFGYSLQNLPRVSQEDLGLPDLWFAFYEEVAVRDHQTGKSFTVGSRTREPIPDEWLLSPSPPQTFPPCSFELPDYRRAFRKTMDHIAAGDIYQLNLCQRFSAPYRGDPWETYAQIREAHPTALSAFFNTGTHQILSASPELFLKKSGCWIETCPIKGTVREPHLVGEKEIAEHIMIVDLERNDLGQVCEYGTVAPERLARMESCGEVHHLVSTVRGKLRKAAGVRKILEALFPGGSITGAPKRRAMEIIGTLEPHERGIYTGALGWFGFSGNIMLNLPIRTVLIGGGHAHFYAGGGVVADSTPEGEYQEILDKGLAFFKTLGLNPETHALSQVG